MKTESPDDDKKQSTFVEVNPLDSSKALESKKYSTSKQKDDAGRDSPVLKSLFDVQEN